MRLKLLALLFLFTSINKLSQAQTAIIYANLYNTSPNACNLTQTVELYSSYCYFSPSSLITGTIDWGDGTVVSLNPFTTGSQLPCDSSGLILNHTYSTTGTYTVSVIQSGPGAASNTQNLVINNAVQCIDYSGYVYTDANGNCTYDPGESVSVNTAVSITAPSGISYVVFTNSNGFYQVSGFPHIPGNYTISLLAPAGIMCPAVQTYTMTTPTGSNLNFGYSSVPSFGILNLVDSTGGNNCSYSHYFNADLSTCNIPNGSTINYSIDYGDGNVSNLSIPFSSNGLPCQTITLPVAPHTYASQGNYTVTVTASALGTLSASNSTSVNVASCINVSGNLFFDANANCSLDPFEQPYAYNMVVLQTSGASYSVWSDMNGAYSFSVPFSVGNYTVTPTSSSTNTWACPSQVPFISNSITQSNVDFAYTPSAPNITGYILDSLSCTNLLTLNMIYLNACGFLTNATYSVNMDFGDGNSASTTATQFSSGNGCVNLNAALSHTYANSGIYYRTATISSGSYSVVLYDTVVVGSCGNVSGYTYQDANNNCMMDPGEQIPYQSINLSLNGSYIASGYSDFNGYYSIQYPFVSGNTYVVESNPSGSGNSCYTVGCPVAANYLVTTQNTTNLDFGYTLNNTNYDNAITGILAWCCGILQAGANRNFKLYYHNYLCGSNNGTVSVTLPGNFNFISSNPAPASVVGNVITWNFNNLTNTSWGNSIDFTAYVPFLNPSNVPYVIGDAICLTSTISSTSGGTDVNPSNNTLTECFYIGTSYDPNDKHPFPKGDGVSGEIQPGTDLQYTIRFQNTGTFPAQQVYILDTLESDLNASSVEVLSSSHRMVFTQNGSSLKFEFPNIMLPDSVSDPEGSMGFVKFKVKHVNGITPGTVINNKAGIYFDFNAPIITNTTVNTIKGPSGINEIETSMPFYIFPNPASEFLQVAFNQDAKPKSMSLFNATGMKVQEIDCQNRLLKIDVQALPAGVYILQMMDQGGKNYHKHFVKE